MAGKGQFFSIEKKGRKTCLSWAPRSPSKLPEGSIPPADLCWPNCFLQTACLQAEAYLQVRASSASKWMWGSWSLCFLLEQVQVFLFLQSIRRGAACLPRSSPACANCWCCWEAHLYQARWAPCRLQGMAGKPQLCLLARWAQRGAGGMGCSWTLAEWGILDRGRNELISACFD